MKRCSFCEWIPILPWPVWPLAWQRGLGQNTVVGSMTLLLAIRGNIATRSMSGPPFALQLHRTTVGCRATQGPRPRGGLWVGDKGPVNWIWVALNVLEHLIEVDKEGQLVPGLATGWHWLDDHTL